MLCGNFKDGCNIGISKMANVSKSITEDFLKNFVNWYISLDNINAANQSILDLLGKLSLASIYHYIHPATGEKSI
ncbi:Tn3 family transposase [Legionella adelaidensis]|uniref:Tn3 family transposase n=1 Tax=Legionella adelaidensis TaxID=45056 RepID=UPI003988EFEA